MIHTETQSIIESERREQTIKFMDAEKGFIRFGELPRDGKSKNHRDNTLEVGVSCFYAEFAKDGTYRLLLTPVQEVSYISVSGRIPYRLYGELVGTGADGEPLLCVERYEKLE